MTRNLTAGVLALASALAGCRDMGLEGNIPPEEARRAPPPALVSAVFGTAEVERLRLILDGRLWVASGEPVAMDEARLRPIGSAAGEAIYAMAWDRPPYRTVFTHVPAADLEVATPTAALAAAGPDRWQPYLPVVGR